MIIEDEGMAFNALPTHVGHFVSCCRSQQEHNAHGLVGHHSINHNNNDKSPHNKHYDMLHVIQYELNIICM